MATAKHTEAVKLIVKAPNQLIEDQNVDCDPSWTVLKLKEHLSHVYPTQPVISDQKLIYSGQLLADDTVLKDVLRKYEGQKAHSLHLVCAPPRGTPDIWRRVVPNQQLRHHQFPRVVRATPQAPVAQQAAPPVVEAGTSGGAPEGWAWLQATQQRFLAASSQHPAMAAYAPAAMSYDPASLAQMQQAYSQYMAQYLCHLQQAGLSPQMLGSMQQQGWGAQPSPAPPVAPAANLPPPGAELNNPPQNNPAPMQGDDDEMRLGRQRDWLDWFYVLSRLLVLFSIVYFYSSLKRFVLVSALGLLLYLYHLGYFRMQGAPEVVPDNNNVVPEPAPEQPAPEAEQPAEAAPPEEGLRQRHPAPEVAPEAPPEAPEVAPVVEGPSLVGVTWTFFSSFFASLIPDRPNVAA